jgi:hypothetical protein
MESKPKKEKHKQRQKALLDKIIIQRKKSAKIISNIVHNILYNNISRKRIIFIKRIIITRKNSAIKIQSFFRGYIIRNKMQYYISKTRTCYLIETGFSPDFKKLQMIVLYNGKNKVFDLIYDTFFNKYLLFLDRILVDKDSYKVQFISDGKIIIDTNHETYEEKGIYYNIIDFKKIRKKEEKAQRKNKILIKSACISLKEKNLSIVPKNINNKIENDNHSNKTEEDLEKLGGSMKFHTPKRKLVRSLRLSNLNTAHSSHRKKNRSAIKGILKTNYSHSRNKSNNLKVKFGYIEFSS